MTVPNHCTLLMYDFIIKTLSLFFNENKAKFQKRNEMKIRASNLVKQKLWHMDAYNSAITEQHIELLKKTWNLA